MSRPPATELRRDVWSRFWATGVLHSCATSYRDNYAGPVGEFWQRAFAALVPGDSVLDIATGNGALPRLLLGTRPETSIECDAVDLAQIAPAWLDATEPAQRRRVRLHGGVVAESLPFRDGTFSLIVSQYGIEYTDLSRSVPEMLRVLAPAGRIRIVAHHAESRPVQLAHEEIGHIDWLSSANGLLDDAAAMMPFMARAATPAGRAALATDSQANAARARFNARQDAMSARIAESPCPDVLHEVRDAIGQLFRVAMTDGADKAQHALATMRGSLADSRLRLEELRRHALDDAGVRAFREQLARGGAGVTYAALNDGSHLLGWVVCSDPAAARKG